MFRLPRLGACVRTALIACSLYCALPSTAAAQGLEGYGGGAKIYLDRDSTRFLRVLLWSQIWTRWMQQNPGTQVNNNPNTRETFDIGIRRTRILMHGQISPRILVFWIIGVNNQTFATGGLQGGDIGGGTSGIDGKRPQVFVHDSWAEFKVSEKLYVGGGVLTWSGLSRMTNAATLNFLMVDAPIYNWTTIDATDQFARTMGLYAKGSLGKLNYRAVLSKPFAIAGGQQAGTATVTVPPPAGTTGPGTTVTVPIGDLAATNALVATPARFQIANWNPNNNTLMPQLYVNYDFWEQESQVLPFMVGSYLGTKKVFNIGAGFQYDPQGMRYVRARDSVTVGTTRRAVLPTDAANPAPVGSTRDATPTNNGDWVVTPMRHLAVDAFLDLPLGHDGDALTAHSAWYNLDYGPNYVRNIGIMPIGVANPATRSATTNQFNFTQPTFAGGGAAYPIHGTGSVWYTQAGYLLPKKATKHFARLQPTAALSYVSFDRLGESYVMPEAGVNWIFAGQNAKITLQWRNRPLYESAVATRDGLPAVLPTAAAPTTNQLYPLQTGMRRAGSRSDIIMQFHAHF
jgi:hypothetical protein